MATSLAHGGSLALLQGPSLDSSSSSSSFPHTTSCSFNMGLHVGVRHPTGHARTSSVLARISSGFHVSLSVAAPGYNRGVACRHLYSVALSNNVPDEDSSSLPSEEHESKIDLSLPRRRLQVSFTCDACGERSQRLINPHSYARGTVFVQCRGCEVYHKLVDNLGLIEEYDFRLETDPEVKGADA